ncbi:hypothetical protein JCM1840_007269 [Sporobolomyces johnsonii]
MAKKPSLASQVKPKGKGKGKLAKALSGQQQAQFLRQQQQRAEQAQLDREKAIKTKMAQGGAKRKQANAAAKADGDEADARDGAVAGGTGQRKAEADKQRTGVQPFRRGERVLLVGEGNFSFSHSLLLPLSTASASSSSTPPPQPIITPSLLLCTSYDALPVALEKYPDLMSHVEPLRAAGATVLFGVDGTKLDENKEVLQFAGLGGKGKSKGKGKEIALEEEGAGFDKIVFNFPHVGQGITDQARNIRVNQTLLLEFYRSASQVLRRGTPRAPSSSSSKGRPSQSHDDARSPSPSLELLDETSFLLEETDPDSTDLSALPPPPPPTTRGTVLLTLRTAPPYSLWLPAHLATKGALLAPSILPPTSLRNRERQPTFKTIRSWNFDPVDWEGYEHRRTIGWDERKSFKGNEDIRVSAKERRRLAEAEAEDDEGREAVREGPKGGKDKGKGSGEKGTGMRTWEFELVYEKKVDTRDGGWARGAGGMGAGGKRKRAEAEDDDLSD